MTNPRHGTIVVPTYNERANLPVLVDQILRTTPYSILVVDDESPDGTGAIADELARASPARVTVIHRSPPRGLGLSYVDGMRRALEIGADVVFQMDADLSHRPEDLPRLASAAQNADVVVGSRYLARKRVPGWPRYRLMLSVAANQYVRLITRLGVRDVTSGFKCWRRDALASVLASPVQSEGYSIQFEMLYYAARNGHRITEVPIVFVDRLEGASKMSGRVIRESIYRPWQLSFGSLRRRRATPARAPLGFDPASDTPGQALDPPARVSGSPGATRKAVP